MNRADSNGRIGAARASEGRLRSSLLVRKGRAGPVAGSPAHAASPLAETPAATDAITETRQARGVSDTGQGSTSRLRTGSTSSPELTKLTVRIPQLRHQALRLAAARRGISIQGLIGEMIEALMRTELSERPHCACLQAALELNGKACDGE